MTRQLTFLHAADLHLGAPFRGLRALSDAWATRLLKAIPEAYDRIVEAALQHQVDFVVIAGDVFDSARASYADCIRFFDGLKRLDAARIPVYLCTGNHDPFTSWQRDFFALPENTTMFAADKPSFALFEREGEPLCLLGGRGYYNQTWPADKSIAEGLTRAAGIEALGERAASAPFAVAVLHTGLDLDPVKAPTNPSQLLQAGFDYWALGHIHRRHAVPADNPRLVFSGCVQGRDIGETGKRGVNLVTLTQDSPNRIEFIPTASVVWQRMDVDMGDCTNLSDVTDKVVRELFRMNGQAQCEEMCARITLVGTTALHDVLERPGVMEDLRASINDSYPEFFCDALVDATVRPLDKQALRREGLFPAVFLQLSESLQADRDAAIAYVQEEFLKKGVQPPSAYTRHMDDLTKEAENLVLDLLTRSEDQ